MRKIAMTLILVRLVRPRTFSRNVLQLPRSAVPLTLL